jgi:hypothetical protein
MTRRWHMLSLVGVVVLISGALAQPRGPMRGGWRGGNEDDLGGSLVRTEGSGIIDEDLVRTAREVVSHSTGRRTGQFRRPSGRCVHLCALDFQGRSRILRRVTGAAGGWGGGGFSRRGFKPSYRLQELYLDAHRSGRPRAEIFRSRAARLPVHSDGAPGYIKLREEEEKGLRRYLLAGGTLVVIDFWGTREWEGFAAQMKRVMPERGWTDLGFEHPIFPLRL